MNISPDGVTVRFKTEPESLFEVEKSGAKPNTVRILDAYEADPIKRDPPTKIIIQHQQEIFLRTITNIHMTEYFFGKVIAIFSWSNEIVQDPYAHTSTLEGLRVPSPQQHTVPQNSEERDGFVQISVTHEILTLLQRIAHGKSMNSTIRYLYQLYLDTHTKEGGLLHDQ